MMMKNLLFIFCLMMALVSYGQDVIIKTQVDIDTFAVVKVGNLKIEATDLNSISGFETLEEVTGSITITGNEQLKTLNAFHNLTTVGRIINIQNNEDLETISGFGKLNKIGTYVDHWSNGTDYIRIADNRSLLNVSGFDSLKKLVGHFILENNVKLKSPILFNKLDTVLAHFIIRNNDGIEEITSGFENLTKVNLSLVIQGNDELLIVNGFPKLKDIGSALSIGRWDNDNQANTNLTQIDGFASLENVGHSVQIELNEKLKIIRGLNALKNVGRWVRIHNNEDLESINGFKKLEDIGTYIDHWSEGTDYIRIGDNRSLVSIEGFDSLNHIVGHFVIANNDKLTDSAPFNSLEEVDAHFIIRNNDKLTSLVSGYNNLYSVGLAMVIQNNNSLLAVDGFPNLTTIGSYLSIGKWDNDSQSNEDLQTINGFNVLNSVGHSVQIELNEKLKSIDGFNSLSNIGRWLRIQNNEDLETINGFENLEDVGTYIDHWSEGTDYVSFGNNQSLTDINGFDNLNHIVGHFIIANNDKLVKPALFNNLEEVDAHFIIRNNDALEKITTGFNNLYEVGLAFVIQDNEKLEEISGFINLNGVGSYLALGKWDTDSQVNPNLTKISGFDLLENIGHSFKIQSNENLKTISGFASLTDVLRYFNISNCNNLISINGFGLLEDVGTYIGHWSEGTDYFYVSKNEKLESINGFCSLQTITGDLRIEENPNLTKAENIFNNLEHVKNNFKLFGNSKFTECCILNCKLIDEITDNTIQIENNSVGCNTMDEIKSCGYSLCAQFCTDDKDVCCECDGEGTTVWYIDIDNDEKGDANISVISCTQPTGFVADNTDECDGVIDECGICNGNGKQTWYADADGDGRGNPQVSVSECNQPEGYVSFPNDFDESGVCVGVEGCTDNTACNYNPNAVCSDNSCTYVEADKCDCSGTPQITYYADTDGDGLGDLNNPTDDCEQPDSYVTNADDDDDTMASCTEFPTGFCDCNGTVPETTYYRDADNDGFGTAAEDTTACSLPLGYSEVNTDLDDNDPNTTDMVSVNLTTLQNITLYPNPTTGLIQIKGLSTQGEAYQLQISDTQGKVLLAKQLPKQVDFQLQLNRWAKGIYLLKVSNDQYIYHNKVMLMR